MWSIINYLQNTNQQSKTAVMAYSVYCTGRVET